jgi:hypothetical protein
MLGIGSEKYLGTDDRLDCDTVLPAHPALSAKHLQSFTVLRRLTLTRGDSVAAFGTQKETVTSGWLKGRSTLLDVLVFDTPRGKTVDSSWVEPTTFRLLRFTSHNAERTVTLDFEGQRVRARTVPANGTPTEVNRELGVGAFEWNILALAISALPLRPGYCAQLPVYSDRFGRVSWYAVEVVRDTTVPRASRAPEPVWEVIATGEPPAPSARYWVSRRHRVVSRVLVSEPGISILYARD